MDTETVGAVAAVSVAAVQVQMVRVGAKLVPLANVPFANRDEWHPAYMRVKGWLQGRSRWESTELADAANALAEWTLDGRRLGGKDIKKQCNGDEERACAWLVGLGVSQAAAARIYRGCNPKARGPVTSAATSTQVPQALPIEGAESSHTPTALDRSGSGTRPRIHRRRRQRPRLRQASSTAWLRVQRSG
jgi:hypothetical protein